jgi:putative acetyltransferase
VKEINNLPADSIPQKPSGLPITIRLARSSDIAAIVEVQVLALQVLGAKHYTPEQLQALIEDKSKPRDYLEEAFVAELEGQIVGFAAIGFSLWVVTVHAVFVHPNFARRGIGTTLLHHLILEARKGHYQTLWVTSALNAEPFYNAYGFESLYKTSIQLRSGISIPCIAMKKSLMDLPTLNPQPSIEHTPLNKRAVAATRPINTRSAETDPDRLMQIILVGLIIGFLILLVLSLVLS